MSCARCRHSPKADGREWCQRCIDAHVADIMKRRAGRPRRCLGCRTGEAESGRFVCTRCRETKEAKVAEKAAAKEARKTARETKRRSGEARRPSRAAKVEEDKGRPLDATLLAKLRSIDPARVRTTVAARRLLQSLADGPESPDLDADIRLLSRLLAGAEATGPWLTQVQRPARLPSKSAFSAESA